MSATIIPTTTGVTIQMQQPKAPCQTQATGSSSLSCTSSTVASISTSSSTKMSMKTSSTMSSTKTTKVTKTTSSSSSSGGFSSKTSSTTTSSSSSGGSSSYKTVTTKSSSSSYSDNLADMFGIDTGKEMEKLQLMVDEQMSRMRSDRFCLKPMITSGDSMTTPESSIVHLDKSSLMDYVDKANSSNLRFNFDMGEFSSESVNVKTVGNQIEVHAQRKTKTADGETSEEYSRCYEMPTSAAIEADKVTSSLFKEGVLTVQLPMSEALKE